MQCAHSCATCPHTLTRTHTGSYVEGTSGSNCPTDSIKITSLSACNTAARSFGYPEPGDTYHDNDPGGCFEGTGDNSTIYYNSLSGSAREDRQLICASRTGKSSAHGRTLACTHLPTRVHGHAHGHIFSRSLACSLLCTRARTFAHTCMCTGMHIQGPMLKALLAQTTAQAVQVRSHRLSPARWQRTVWDAALITS